MTMTDKINVTIRLDKSKTDFENLTRVMNEISDFKTTAKDTEEGRTKVQDELVRKLREAELKVTIN